MKLSIKILGYIAIILAVISLIFKVGGIGYGCSYIDNLLIILLAIALIYSNLNKQNKEKSEDES